MKLPTDFIEDTDIKVTADNRVDQPASPNGDNHARKNRKNGDSKSLTVSASHTTPTVERKSKLSTLGKIFRPWKWKRKKKSEKIEKAAVEINVKFLCACLEELIRKGVFTRSGYKSDSSFPFSDSKFLRYPNQESDVPVILVSSAPTISVAVNSSLTSSNNSSQWSIASASAPSSPVIFIPSSNIPSEVITAPEKRNNPMGIFFI
ncbi:Phosphatase and actin regulator 4 [Bulinus truncatus]|nr:Phosphatase and actin regulator 4 [Bulinus truncatus]